VGMRVVRQVAEAAEILRQGGLVAYPTETFYGLGALVSRRPALERLAAAKLRPPGKPLPVIVGRTEDLQGLVARLEPLAERLAARFWPGPLTLVLPAAPGLPGEIVEDGRVAVRLPGSSLARALAQLAGGPVISTSANPSGGPPPVRADELDAALTRHLDAVLDGGPTPGGLPSTLVSVEPAGLRLLRAGAVPWEEILPVLAGGQARR
jgi:L-threonylcarbamoyladenylate synthase